VIRGLSYRDFLTRLVLQIHDSLHTYEHMLWEFRQAYPHLPAGGLLFSDDAKWNSAFPEFAFEVRALRAKILRRRFPTEKRRVSFLLAVSAIFSEIKSFPVL